STPIFTLSLHDALPISLFIGCTSSNPCEVVQKMNFVKDLGADGVLLGVPYYETLHVQDAIKFYHDIADLFPNLNIVIYHNPDNQDRKSTRLNSSHVAIS